MNSIHRLLWSIWGRVTLCGALLLTTVPLAAQAQSPDVDLEIVLAVDGSGSISASEFRLQLEGYANALHDDAVQSAAVSGPLGKIAIAMMVWSDAAFKKFETDWFIIDSPAAAGRYADIVEIFHHHSGRNYGIGGGGTGIGAGIEYALQMIDENGIDARRRTIDVSGDGVETDPWFREAMVLPEARALAASKDVTINGLAILTDFKALDRYYEDEMITGPGAFVIEAKGWEDFAEAIQRKLFLEFMSPVAGYVERHHAAGSISRKSSLSQK